jgi:alpha-ketoglutarate-dependent taurine dioxygenase
MLRTHTAASAAVVDNVALVIRDQNSARRNLAAVAAGEPMEQHFTQYALPGCPLVHEVSNRHMDKSGKRVKHGAGWHTDHTNHVRPPKYTSLYAVALPSSGGDTAVVNMRAGYEALPEAIKQKIEAMKTVNVFQGSASARYSGGRPTRGLSAAEPVLSAGAHPSRKRDEGALFPSGEGREYRRHGRRGVAGAAGRSA